MLLIREIMNVIIISISFATLLETSRSLSINTAQLVSIDTSRHYLNLDICQQMTMILIHRVAVHCGVAGREVRQGLAKPL